MLIGEYTHTLDEKNSMSLPVKFRKEMGDRVVVAPGLDNCLSIFTTKEWQKISGKLSDSSMLQVIIEVFRDLCLVRQLLSMWTQKAEY